MAGERILIVEDDQRIGSTLMRALVAAGYDASWEQSGQAAIDSVVLERSDLVLLDLGLPDLDGLTVCREIHMIDPTIDLIMLTARDEELDVVVGLDAGAVDYITKPFRLAELLARIRAQLCRTQPSSGPQLTVRDVMTRHSLRSSSPTAPNHPKSPQKCQTR